MPFASRAEVDWSRVKTCGFAAVGVGVLILLFLPSNPQTSATVEPDVASEISEPRTSREADPTEQALLVMSPQSGRPDFYRRSSGGSSVSGTRSEHSMVIVRQGGGDAGNLPAGTRIRARLLETAIVGERAMPVIGEVTEDLVLDGVPIIPRGSRILGEVAFDSSTDRAKVDWRSVRLADGRERPLSGIGVGNDGQAGVEGRVRSETARNLGGQLLTRFIAAYAEGSMQRGPLGSSEGGSDNGLKYAVAETAKDRANAWAENLSREVKWIEVPHDRTFMIVLTEAFVFRDPGFVHGR